MNSSALPHYMYGDPSLIMERRQEFQSRKSCQGCAHAFAVQIAGSKVFTCSKLKKYGRRCQLFKINRL
jgi:hypothetical protein